MIKSLGGNRYSLAVPRTSLFSVWVEPIVEVEVNLALTGSQRAVIIQVKLSALPRADRTLQRQAIPAMHLAALRSTSGVHKPLLCCRLHTEYMLLALRIVNTCMTHPHRPPTGVCAALTWWRISTSAAGSVLTSEQC